MTKGQVWFKNPYVCVFVYTHVQSFPRTLKIRVIEQACYLCPFCTIWFGKSDQQFIVTELGHLNIKTIPLFYRIFRYPQAVRQVGSRVSRCGSSHDCSHGFCHELYEYAVPCRKGWQLQLKLTAQRCTKVGLLDLKGQLLACFSPSSFLTPENEK